jgi:serpin B
MKSQIPQILIILVSVSSLLSCEKLDPLQKETPKITLHKKAAEIIQAENALAFELFREVNRIREEENIMISPLSVSYALGMTYNGAAGTTLEAFNDVLHFSDLTAEEVNGSYKDLMDQMLNLDDKVEFSIANSIWYRPGFQVLSEFLQTNNDYFDAGVQEVDFSDPQTLELINGWIEDKTKGRIKDMLDEISSNAMMYLINAIYFNAPWKYEFVKEDTYPGDFKLLGGTNHMVDYMSVTGSFRFTSHEDFKAVELPYGDSAFSMVVILPHPDKKVSDLLAGLDTDKWQSWFENSRYYSHRVDLPKFKYEFKELLNEPLDNLGLGDAFSPAADFTKITPPGGIYISRAIHQTFIDVQEEGTEAAAATIIEHIDGSSGGEHVPTYFKADRPFLYVIKENSTGAIVFIGKVGKPDYS